MKRKVITDAAVSRSRSSYKGREGILVLDENDCVLHFSSAALGNVTSNEGEYLAMQHGVEAALLTVKKPKPDDEGRVFSNSIAETSLEVFTDSQLVFNQMLGNYKTKKKSLLKTQNDIKSICRPCKSTKVKWHRRDRDLAVLADFASKHPRRTKAMFQRLEGEHYDKFTDRAVALLIKDDDAAAKEKAKEQEDANN